MPMFFQHLWPNQSGTWHISYNKGYSPERFFPTMLTKIFVGLALMMASSQVALATDWQYCLAPSHAEHKVYITGTFPVRGVLGDADGVFERMLDKAGLRHDDVQCPRADDERSIVMMMQYAISFNQEIGNTIIHLPLEKAR
jgi:hypothetical protein